MARSLFEGLGKFGMGLSKSAPAIGRVVGAGFLVRSFDWLNPKRRK